MREGTDCSSELAEHPFRDAATVECGGEIAFMRRILFIELADKFLDFVERRLVGGLLLRSILLRCYAEFDIGIGTLQISFEVWPVFLARLGLVMLDRLAHLVDSGLIIFSARLD